MYSNEYETTGFTKFLIGSVVFILFCFAVDWVVMGEQFFIYKYFAPRQEAVRRQVYEQTKSYKTGSVTRLATLCTQVNSADDDHKPMLNDVIAHEFVEWDTADVPGYLQSCLASARR